jgi:V/A-type H+-transporting ATPase subunit I
MFYPARMRKLKIITLDQYADSAVRSLHEEGIVQIHDISERIQQDAEWAQILKPSKVTPQTGKIASLLMKTTGIADFLGTMGAEDKGLKDTIKGFINPQVFDKREVEDLDSEALIERAESLLSEVESKTKVFEGKLASLDSEKTEIDTALSVSEKLINFDVDFADLESSKYIFVMAGKMPLDQFNEFQESANDFTDELVVLEADDDAKTEKTIIVITLKNHGEDISGLLRRMEFERFEISGLSGKPKDLIANSNNRLESITQERKNVLAELRDVARTWEDDLMVLKEQLEIEKDRNEVYASFGKTKKTVMIEAWVPVKKQEKALEIIEQSTEGHSVVDSEEPDPSEVPVLQDNPRFAKPYETFVGMYSPLKYNEIDPTILMAIVFPFFFGFCLTDAGYGIIDALIGLILYRGLGKVNPFMKSFGIIFIACGVWTFILGMVTNGFIGDFFPRWILGGVPLFTTLGSIDAFVNPQNILYLALIVGVIHINIGLVMGAINNIRMGDNKAALGTQIVWIILELGILLLLFGGIYVGVPVILLAIGILIYANGLFGLLDLTGFMGNLLSYGRLLALCLSTGGIALTVNILTDLSMSMIPYIGIILAPFVFIGGHIANLAFQSLGAFINSLRLHYVEFFAQFYMGGKTKFEAFNAERNFTKVRR